LPKAWAGEWGLAAVRSELHSFQDNVKGVLEDMKAIFKELLQEVRKQRSGATPPALSEVGKTGLEEGRTQEEGPPEEEAPVVDPVWVKTKRKYSVDGVSAPAVKAASASPEEPKDNGKSRESDAPEVQEVRVEVGSQMHSRREKQPARKRRGEAEKLLADQPARPKRRASAKKRMPRSWLSLQ
jgi:hypothetical protein